MRTPISAVERAPLQSLFECDLEDRLLLSVHLLGKPTSAQLFRLHRGQFSNLQDVQAATARLSRDPHKMLARIVPIDLTNTSRRLPHVFLDTLASRRHIEKAFGIPFKRPPVPPSRDWRFLRHDVELVADKISVELTARVRATPFGYQSHFDDDGAPIYPRVTITDGTLTHTLQPRPDDTLIVGDYHLILEGDCGEETITLGNIIRDATVGRKQLVYDQLERMGTLDNLGWGKRIYCYVMEGKKPTKTSARKRISRCIVRCP